ncbi:acyl-CoA synthetase [Ramlibacter alkalitolerans]|uniref:AMP-binding protein n=1 Tax=Ramlibacter alkalitolerans TaxID=2039631 RepID=A0ABS1JHC0_9BURK|nr:AMP-binding protein [Ramlibacter alkalitolerans]MBL0423592.1 AMP-binding protein [Ramlibacter alkalitolerans]
MDRGQGRDNWAAMHGGFGWQVPDSFNIAQACCARWAREPDAAQRVAIIAHGTEGATLTFARLQQEANAMSNLLVGLGVRRGDRVAIVMPQRFETAIAYMAVLQLGAVAMPLSILFGPDALEYRLQDSEAVAALCDESSAGAIAQVRAQCPALRTVVGIAGAAAHADIGWEAQRAQLQPEFAPVQTHADEGAVLIYTSGTTGPPKGALIPHRALIGNLPGFMCSQNWFGFDPLRPGSRSDAVFWSPADWAWTGGLMDALLPSLYFGRPIVACNARFSPETAFTLMQQHGVTHTFLFPTALKAMMKAYPQPRTQFALALQAIMSAGEAVGDAVFGYCRDQLGVVVNEMFGQTEINYVVGNCAMNGRTEDGIGWPARADSMGRPYPGHRVAVIDDEGQECPPGVPGDVAVHRYDVHGKPDPIFFLGYWKNEDATRRKFTGDWCRTGDLATRDADGYLWYQGRADDVFKAAGYRIGPSEIENCLVKHPAVINAAVVPKPDADRGALVKAYVVLAPQVAQARAVATPGPDSFDARLVAELQSHVKDKLAPYEYPKEIEFIEALPMTTTGKVQRRVLRLQEEERARGART